MSAEFDITEHIYLTNQTYKIKVSFQHVYGHQDTRPKGKMSAEAKFDEKVDRLARLYQDEFRAYSPIAHMHPSSPVVLEINGMPITSNI